MGERIQIEPDEGNWNARGVVQPAAVAPTYAYPPAHAGGGVAIQQTFINVGNRKSVGGAIALALFFGPLGMFYATVPGALVMFVVSLAVVIPTLGLGLLITLPVCAIWAGVAASSHNGRLGGFNNQVAVQPHGGSAASLAGWHPDPMGSGQLRYWDGANWTTQYAALPAGH